MRQRISVLHFVLKKTTTFTVAPSKIAMVIKTMMEVIMIAIKIPIIAKTTLAPFL